MNITQLAALLDSILPGKVTYYAWRVGDAPPLPYICYYSTGSDNFAADNIVYHSRRPVRIELYTKTKDLATEAAVEQALTAAGIYWDRDESYIDDEQVYLTIYEVEING